MNIGTPGDNLSLARVFIAMMVGGAALAGIGYLVDFVVGPAIAMSGWWTVFGTGGICFAGMIQAAREFTVPQPDERKAVAAEARAKAREQADAEAEPDAPAPDA